MTDAQCSMLSHTPDSEFLSKADAFGFDAAGPSVYGAFLVNEPDGLEPSNSKAWLFSAIRKHGRTVVPSVWSEHNVRTIEAHLHQREY